MVLRRLLFIFTVLVATAACHKGGTQPAATRSFRMGFANSAPRPDYNAFIQSLQSWSQRADAAIISTEVPWDSLLAGETIEQYISHNYTYLLQFYQQKNFPLWIYIDPENGLDRKNDAVGLTNAGKSIADPDMQAIYVQFVIKMDSLLHPDHLGLALETNLIRGTASPAIYSGVKSAASAAAAAVRKFDSDVKLSVSVQVEWAWGLIGGQPYQGIDADISDFSFLQELGLSTYPYFNVSDPDSLPSNYYTRLTSGKSLPVFISESGWSSAKSDLSQEAYIRRESVLLNNAQAIAWFQLTFTDIDISSLPPSTPAILTEFSKIGLVDANFNSKPALGDWDKIFAEERR